MTVTLEIGVIDLLTEFLTDTLIILCPFHAAGTVAAGALQSFLYHLYHFLIFVQSNSHNFTSLPLYYKVDSSYVNHKTFRIQEG